MILFLWNRSTAEKNVGKHYFLLKNAFAHFVGSSFGLQWVQGHCKLNFLEDLYIFIVMYVGMSSEEGTGLWKTSAPMQNKAFALCLASKFQLINLLICFHSQMEKKKKSLRICTGSRLIESHKQKRKQCGKEKQPEKFLLALPCSPTAGYHVNVMLSCTP